MRWVSFIPSPARRTLLRAAQHDHVPVLITGNTGAGKSRIGEWLHMNSPRSMKAFRKIDPRQDLVPQILSAGAGSLMFEDFHIWGQPHLELLLGLVRSRSLIVDGVRHIVHTRVIVTMAHGFDEASPLWGHFQTYHIHIPALAERPEEFEDIVLSLMNEASMETEKLHLKGLDRVAWMKLKAHSWPGNLRELREVIRTAVSEARGDQITAEDLPDLHHRQGLRTDMLAGAESVDAVDSQARSPEA